MADNNTPEVIIKVSADTSSAEQSIKDTKDQLGQLNNTDLSKSVKNFKQQLKEANDEAQRMRQVFGENSAEFAKAAQQVANIRDEIDVYNRTVVAFDPGNKLNAFVGIARSAAGAVQGVAGAMTFLGVESNTAMETMARLQGIMAFTDAINQLGDLQDFWKAFILRLKSAKAATEAQTVAQKGATVATRAFGVALKSIGIGLLISAIAYLVSNWDDLKESITSSFPALKDTSKMFNDIKQVVFGVGNSILQFVIAPIKSLVQLIQGDFKGALDEIKKGVGFTKNYIDGANKERLNQQQELLRKSVQNSINAKERELQVLQAKGEDTYKLEKEIIQKKLSLHKKGSEEYDALLQEANVLEAKRTKELRDKRKQAAEKAAQERKSQAEKERQEKQAEIDREKAEIAETEKETQAILAAQNKTGRELELAALKQKFDANKKLYDKYGQDVTKLTEAYNIERAGIEKKYADIIEGYITDSLNNNLDTFEQKKVEINKKIDELLKNADESQKAKLEDLRKNQLGDVDKEKGLNTVAIKAETNLITTETYNTIDENDTPEQAKEKIDNLYTAKVDAENANFELEKERLKGNNDAIEKLTAEHNANLVALEEETADKKKQIDDAAKEAKLANISAVANMLGAAANLFEGHTVAGKALAVAQTTMDTYVAAQKAYSSLAGIPIVGPALGAAAAGVAVATGLMNVKKILAVKVGKKGGAGGSVPGGVDASMPQAPMINVNQLAEQKVQDVRVTNTQDTIVQAYIVERDLETYEQKKDFKEKMKI